MPHSERSLPPNYCHSRLNVSGVEGEGPSCFSWGSKGGILFQKRISPLWGSPVTHGTNFRAKRGYTTFPLAM